VSFSVLKWLGDMKDIWTIITSASLLEEVGEEHWDELAKQGHPLNGC